ncbi:hypothetical protein BsWGS_04614 [Bradybaena similaris]
MTYFNVISPRYIDEARYQTIGRGHGFSELDGVPFKINEKYQHSKTVFQSPSHNIYQLLSAQGVVMANAYTFELEKKVLTNMEYNQRES